MSDTDVVQNIVTIEIDLEEDDGSPVDQTTPGEERELTNTEETLTEQEDNERKQEEGRDEKTKVTIKQENAGEPEEPERVENGGSERSLAHEQYIYRQQQRDTDTAPSTRETAEEKRDRDDKPIGDANNKTGEGGSREGGSGECGSSQGTSGATSGEDASGDGVSEEKKAKKEERSFVDDDDSKSNNSSECFIVFD